MTTEVVVQHPILECARRLENAVEDVVDVQPMFMRTCEKQAALVDLARLEARVVELRLRVLAAAEEVGDASGARDAAAWFSHAVQADPQTARSELHLATALEKRERVAAGMRQGTVSTAQARVIVAGLDALPTDLGPELVRSAEETLVGYCDSHRPAELRQLARRILDVVAPEIAEAELAKQLEAEEQRAQEKASLRFRALGDGRTRITGVLPDSVITRLTTYLDAFTSPRHHNHDESGEGGDGLGNMGGLREEDRIPLHRKRAHAFIALLEFLDPATLPEHGGTATTVVVTIDIDKLREDLATAGLLDSDGAISATEARRLACNAKILPVVLDGQGQVLDLGRAQRLFSKAQRVALRLRDKSCRAEGCSIPGTWTEAHHLVPWSQGGTTDLANAISLCSFHHHRIHDHTYTHQRLANGDVRFARRT